MLLAQTMPTLIRIIETNTNEFERLLAAPETSHFMEIPFLTNVGLITEIMLN